MKKIKMIILLLVMAVFMAVPAYSTIRAEAKTTKKSVSYAQKKLLKKVRGYKNNKRNKAIFCAYYEKKGNKVDFALCVSQGDGAPQVGIFTVNLKTGKTKLKYNAHWEKIKLPTKTFYLWK